jgi:hypothetical protein
MGFLFLLLARRGIIASTFYGFKYVQLLTVDTKKPASERGNTGRFEGRNWNFKEKLSILPQPRA